MTKTVSEILFAAAELIEPEGAWTQGTVARNALGEDVEGDAPDAVCFCLIGAIGKATDHHYDAAKPVYELLETLVGDGWIDLWNDAPERTQAEVVAKLREAAEKAREQGQ